jgi:hypothetical protein
MVKDISKLEEYDLIKLKKAKKLILEVCEYYYGYPYTRKQVKRLETIIKKLEEYDKIALFRHVFPDPDSYGAQNALKSIIEATYPNKSTL